MSLHAFDRREGARAVDVPGNFVEDGEKRVHRDEPHAGLDQPPRQQTALAKAIHAVPLADLLGLLRQIERGPGLGAGHHAECRFEVAVEQPGVVAGFEAGHGLVDDRAQLAAPRQPSFANLGRGQQVGHLEIRFRGIGHQRERVVGFAQKARVLAVRQIAARGAHRLGQDHVRRQSLLRPRRNASAQPAWGVLMPPVNSRPVCSIWWPVSCTAAAV